MIITWKEVKFISSNPNRITKANQRIGTFLDVTFANKCYGVHMYDLSGEAPSILIMALMSLSHKTVPANGPANDLFFCIIQKCSHCSETNRKRYQLFPNVLIPVSVPAPIGVNQP